MRNVLGVGLVARLLLLPVGGYGYDIPLMQAWAQRLVSRPPHRFYGLRDVVSDHLPGDLWFLWLLGHLTNLLSPGAAVPPFALKLIPTLADLVIAAFLFLLGRRLAGPSAGTLAAACYFLNPGVIFLTAIWGQWDAVSLAFALAALWLVVWGEPAWAFVPLTWAALIKPPLAALAPLVLLALARQAMDSATRQGRQALSKAVGELALVATICLLLAAAALIPFNVGLGPLPGRWDLRERLRYSLDLYPETTTNAFNLWATPLVGNREPDSQLLLELPVQTWGLALFAAVYVVILARYWRQPNNRAFIWAAFAIAFAAFMLPTRVHERYLLPAIAFAALLAALTPRLRWFFAALSLAFLLNLYWVYDRREPALELEILYRTDLLVYAVALLNLGLLAYTLTRMLPALQQDQEPQGKESRRAQGAVGRGTSRAGVNWGP